MAMNVDSQHEPSELHSANLDTYTTSPGPRTSGFFRMILDEEFTLLYSNEAFQSLFDLNFSHDSIQTENKRLSEILRKGALGRIRQALLKSMDNGETCSVFELPLKENSEKITRLFCSGCFVRGESGQPELVAFVQETIYADPAVWDGKATYGRLAQIAFRDPLTDTLNRSAIEQRISNILQSASRNEIFALFMIDLDNFKQVNDQLGHQQGDQTLSYAASIIQRVFQSTDLVGRLGGDEFVVFMHGGITAGTVRKKARTLVEALQMTAGTVDGVPVSASVGVVIVKGAEQDFDTLYGWADKALYIAKGQGKNRCHILVKLEDSLSVEEIPPVDIVDTIQLQALLQYMDVGIALFEIGERAKLLYTSPGWTTLLGRKIDTVNSKSFMFSRIVSEDREALETVIRTSAEKNTPGELTFCITEDGKGIKWLRIKALPIPYENTAFPVVIAAATDVTKLKEQESALIKSEERIRIAFDQTFQTLWEVDIPKRTFRVFDTDKNGYDEQYTFSGFPESLIEEGIAHPSVKTSFIRFGYEILEGNPKGSAAFVIRYLRTGIYGWAKFSYQILFDKAETPIKAIGIIEEIPSIFNEQARFKQEYFLFETLSELDMELHIANLTDDSVTTISSLVETSNPGVTRYSELAGIELKEIFSEEDGVALRKFFPQALMDAYAGGASWVEEEYRRQDRQGNVQWISCIASLIVEPVARELYAFIVKRNVDSRRRWELSMPGRVERSNTSHLYSRRTAESLIENLLQKKSRTAPCCTLALVEVKGASQLREDVGLEAVKRIRFFIGRLLRILLDHECVVGQCDGERILLFWPEVISGSSIKAKLEQTLAALRRMQDFTGKQENILFAIGISTSQRSQANFEDMYTRAAYVCDKNANHYQDVVAAFEEYVEDNQLLTQSMESMVAVSIEEGRRPLSMDEKEVLLSCLMKLLSPERTDQTMTMVLGVLGTYYEADRVYQLALSEDGTVLNGVYEWLPHGKHSILRRFINLPVGKVALIRNALEKKRPILLRGPSAMEGAKGKEWRFICVPALEKKYVTGFLCIENPQKHYGDTALLSTLISIILSANRHVVFGNNQFLHGKDLDSLTGVLDSNSYVRTLNTLNVDTLSSLGALYLDINGLDLINQQQGYEKGDEMLVSTAKTLSGVFEKAKVFRVYGHAFVVLYPDVMQVVFQKKCEKVQAALEQQHPEGYSLGFTWADKDFTVWKLIEHAKSLMDYNKQSYYRAAENTGIRRETQSLVKLKEAIAKGRYTVYIQPKTKISTSATIGGEALVRYLDPVQGFITPLEFIRRMEKEHVIRELDFFVLDETLRIMQNWKDHGRKLIPISVNFSRQTLLDRSALAATLAIHSRYDVPLEYLEIEITETLGMMERQTVVNAVETFRSQGLRMSLDDFGSAYSSITMLSDIPFDTVKLDKSIISNFVNNPVSRSIVEGMVKVCDIMGSVCIAEGVETLEQVNALREVGCDYAQGYFYDKPLPVDDFENKYLCHTDSSQ